MQIELESRNKSWTRGEINIQSEATQMKGGELERAVQFKVLCECQIMLELQRRRYVCLTMVLSPAVIH